MAHHTSLAYHVNGPDRLPVQIPPQSCTFPANMGGYTLVELLTVVTVIGILATLALPAFSEYTDKTKTGKAKSDIRTLVTEISGYALEKGTPPNSLADINRANFLDPWKQPYQYRKQGDPNPLVDTHGQIMNPQGYDLYSKGKDGQSQATDAPENIDDICATNDDTFIDSRGLID